MLREACEKTPGGHVQLAKEIVAAAGRIGRDSETRAQLDPRTLLKLIKGDENIRLSVAHLRMFDAYFAPLGQSLAFNPLFESASVLTHVSQRTPAFFLGAYPRKERIDISRWDFKSVTQLINDINNHSPRSNYTMEEAVYRDGLSATEFSRLPWYKKMTDDATLIVIGSSRVNHATEHALSEMFPVLASAGNPKADSLPFAFVWADSSKAFKSTFWMPVDSFLDYIDRHDIALDDRKRRRFETPESGARALVVGDRVFCGAEPFGPPDGEGRTGKKQKKDYGLVAVQRRENGAIWVVASGLSGPATFGAAREVKNLTEHLPTTSWGGHSDTMLRIVETTFDMSGPDADPRHITGSTIIDGPRPHSGSSRRVLNG